MSDWSFHITAPNGNVTHFTAPANATDEQLIECLRPLLPVVREHDAEPESAPSNLHPLDPDDD